MVPPYQVPLELSPHLGLEACRDEEGDVRESVAKAHVAKVDEGAPALVPLVEENVLEVAIAVGERERVPQQLPRDVPEAASQLRQPRKDRLVLVTPLSDRRAVCMLLLLHELWQQLQAIEREERDGVAHLMRRERGRAGAGKGRVPPRPMR